MAAVVAVVLSNCRMATRFGVGPQDRFSMCSGIAHDPLQRDIFTPVFFGAQIYIPLEEDITTPGALAKWMARQQINVGLPSLRFLLSHPPECQETGY